MPAWPPERVAAWTADHAFLLLAAALVAAFGLVVAGFRLVDRILAWLAHRRTRPPQRRLHLLARPRGLIPYLTLSLGLVVALVAFVGLVTALHRRSAVIRFDLALARAIHAAATPGEARWMERISLLGSTGVLSWVIVLVGLALLVRRQWRLAAGWIVATIGASDLDGMLKAAVHRPRPPLADAFVRESFWSFPSRHGMVTLVVAGMLAYFALLVVRRPARRLAAVWLAVAWTLVIGFSRVFLGAHYFSDVLGSYAAGLGWLLVCLLWMEYLRPNTTPV